MSKPVLVVKDPVTGTSKIIEFPITEAQALQVATHRHYKGGLYLEMERVPYSEGGEAVLYHHLYPHAPQKWARLATEFDGNLEDGSRRFTPLNSPVPEQPPMPAIALNDLTKAQMALVMIGSEGYSDTARREAINFLKDFTKGLES